MGLKKSIFICLCLVLMSCRDEMSINEQRTKTIVLQAHIVAGDTIDNFFVYTFDEAGKFIPATEATVSISKSFTSVSLEHIGEGRYKDVEGELTVNPENDLFISVYHNEKRADAMVTMPPAFEWEEDPVDIIEVDPEDPEAIVQDISWTELPDYEYVLTMEVLEMDPEPIGFEEGGLFGEDFNEPVPFTSTFLRASDFELQGTHRLSVFSVNKAYSDLYFQSNLQQSQSLPTQESGIEGANGFLIGMTKITDEFIISVP